MCSILFEFASGLISFYLFSILHCLVEQTNGENIPMREAEDGSHGILLADLGGSIQVRN